MFRLIQLQPPWVKIVSFIRVFYCRGCRRRMIAASQNNWRQSVTQGLSNVALPGSCKLFLCSMEEDTHSFS